jgi:uncharacterized protein YcbK (DUF882 family)
MKLNRAHQFNTLIEIVEAITADPNTHTDGQVLDLVWQILEREGFNLEHIMIKKGYRN